MHAIQPHGERSFFHKIVQLANITLIRSTCEHCGATQECSARDSCLEDWENSHHCSHSEPARACA